MRKFCLLFTIMLILCLTSCGETSGERVTNVFSSKEISLPEGFAPNRVQLTKDGCVLLEIDNSIPRTRIVRLSKSGSDYKLTSDETVDEYISYAAFLPDGDLIFTGNDIVARRGEKDITVNVSDLTRNSAFISILSDKDGNIYLSTQSSVLVTDDEFNTLSTPAINGSIYEVATGTDGFVYLEAHQSMIGEAYYRIDPSQKTAEELSSPNAKDLDFVTGGESLWFRSGTGLYSYSDQLELVCDFVNSDLSPSKIGLIAIEDSEHFAMLYDERFLSLTHVPDDKVEPRTLIRVAGTSMPTYMVDEAAEFNRRQSEYRVLLDDYSIRRNADDELRNDLVAGKLPDIMIFGAIEKYHEEYIEQKLFTDLWALIDNDPDFERDELITGILRAGERDGRLYELPTYCIANTLLIKSSNAPGEGWTLSEFLDWAEGLDSAVAIEKNPLELLYMLIRCSTEEFVDYENGVCSFDSGLFARALSFAKDYHPKATDFMSSAEKELNRENKAYATISDKTMLIDAFTDTPETLFVRNLYRFGFEDIIPIGYPDSDGNGTALEIISSFAIVEKSTVKDAAWDFLKGVIGRIPEFSWGELSCSKQALKDTFDPLYDCVFALSRTSSSRSRWTEEQYEKYYKDNIGDDYLFRYTEADYEMMLGMLEGAKASLRTDSTLWSIISEEASAYFEGAKSLDETVRIIQNRCETYVAEHS